MDEVVKLVAQKTGLSEDKAKVLELQFQVLTVADLASMRYCRWAESILALAPLEE